MTKEEFLAKMEADSDWAPGWQAIDEVFQALYPGQEPLHLASVSRAVFGGNCFLDGCSIYRGDGYCHLVTYGMSELYAEPEALGGQWSRWGYEMTMKLLETDPENCRWAVDLLANLARYTYTQKRFLEPWQYINDGTGRPLRAGSDCTLTALITVPDTQAAGVDTLYGRLDFIQLVGITGEEASRLSTREDVRTLAEELSRTSCLLVTDTNRK